MRKEKIPKKYGNIGKGIKKLRKKVGLTQEALAQRMNVGITHVGLIETGRRKPSLKLLERISRVLGIKTRDLIPF